MKEYNGGWGPETQLPAGVDVTGTPGDEVFTVFIPYSLLNDGSFGWSVNVGARNSGGTKFSQYPVDWVRWAGAGVYEGTPVRDWWVMDHVTEITLDCEDKLPHPSEVKQMCYKISFDNDTTPWLTDQYCGDFGGDMKGDECCVDPQGLPYAFNFTEDSLHDLYWRCEDRLGNMWVDEVEYFKVDSVAPTTTKNITGCKYWDDSQQLYYVNCETNITFHPTDGGPVCAVGGVTTYYAWDDGNLTLYEGQVIKPLADGIHTLAYFSQDALGNIEQMQYEDDILDCAPPVIENIRPAYCEYTPDETIEFTVTDPGVMPSGINLASIQVIVDGVADAGFSPQDDCTTTDGGLSYHCLFEAQNISENKTHIAVITASDNVCHSAEDVKRWTNWVNITLTHEDQLSVTCPTCKDACTDTGCPFLECSCAGLPETTDVWVDLIPPQQMCDGDTPYTVPDGTIVDLSMSIGGFYWPYTNLPTVNGQVHASTMPNPQAGVSQVTATTDGLVGESEIEYITCHVTGVWVVANPETLVANGTDTSQLTIQLVDDWGNAVALAGANIELGLDLEGTITPDTVTTDANGQATATLTAGTQTGEATITAEIQGSSITDTTTVEFTEQTIEPFDDELAIAAEQWTLVSTPEPLNDSETGNVFPGDFVLLYNNSDESWIFPPATVDETFGYWVYSMDAETIPLVYNDDPLAVPPATSLGVGWNMIGHNLRQEMSIKDALLSIDGSYAYVLKYTGSGWDLYVAGADNTGPGRFNVMEPGVGYWVYMTQADNYAGLPG
ncbi:MAG: hypothetical protein GF334_11480 [Candidatus Altiarchaeales archaeon]|nr:hypothetical protein [Candidatus Altiarchaeales archaeon]